VEPADTGFDALGRGVDEGKPASSASRYVSKGLTRSRTDKLVVMSGGAAVPTTDGRGGGSGNVTSFSGAATTARGAAAAALKAEPEVRPSPTVALEHLPWTQADAKAAAAEKRAEAKAKGYEGEACGECGNFTLVRNGTCMKCDTCGSTTGCS
jgi:ribonucleoside-diphosphate reductase alpha chain